MRPSYLIYLLLLTCFLTSAIGIGHDTKKILTIRIDNLEDTKNPIYIALFNSASNFPNKTMYKKYIAIPSGSSSATVYIQDIDYGQYAVALFQDKNSDLKLNTNFIGIPTEPYAFSNNVKPKITVPEYQECSFKYNESKTMLSITLIQ